MSRFATTAACADRLDLVDASYSHPGSPEAYALRKLCTRCPIAATCLDLAMRHPEWGIWGATGPKKRTECGARSTRSRAG